MIRKIIKINEELCNGCGLCATACHEGAIDMVNGKAKLMRENYCDGLGDCLPACPTGAISFEEREAPAYDEAAVKAAQAAQQTSVPDGAASADQAPLNRQGDPLPCGCPGTHSRAIKHDASITSTVKSQTDANCESRLSNWPVQIKLAPINAPYFDGANLLVAADCTAFTYGNFHERFIKNHITLIGCPKLDNVDYSEKLTEIIRQNDIKSVTIVRMEVPCCGGLEYACKTALQNSGKFIPWQVVTVTIAGHIIG